jgi:hypothetical protein
MLPTLALHDQATGVFLDLLQKQILLLKFYLDLQLLCLGISQSLLLYRGLAQRQIDGSLAALARSA